MIELNSKQMSNSGIIQVLRNVRDEGISSLFTEQGLTLFLGEHYKTISISAVKKQFLRKDLKELQKSTLDLVHYSQLILEVKENGDIGSVDRSCLFQAELDRVFRKHGLGE